MPMDGNPYRSLGVIGHADGIRAIKADSTRHILFTIGHKCQSLFMWHINFQYVYAHIFIFTRNELLIVFLYAFLFRTHSIEPFLIMLTKVGVD